ncbi:hypothetical protein LWI28_029209 [Acer negundo]|uniref:UBC core domain-containing protein n=1 Tax=Acer negundo TaxID=4023 RepID=A0AAD5JEI9_ACENE|nr:hypothetical protein LWI28_029209 [Acer negundo]
MKPLEIKSPNPGALKIQETYKNPSCLPFFNSKFLNLDSNTRHSLIMETVIVVSGLEHSINKENFKNFDVVEDYSDHHYANIQNCFTNTGSCVYKKIMREWKILSNDLPDSIFVRVYEKRIDLLRAVIIGAQGTPYHDSLFFFDIAFPSGYPTNPPQVFYRSYCLRLNPNLYTDGYVFLSLLNTWHGKGNEKWNPAKSTILQVLVSIQGLVLNAKPYYNEPGAKPAVSWENYNEVVFALSCRTMLYQLLKPPKNFESFVVDHFQDRAFTILRACKAYRDGRVRIGVFSDNGPSSSSTNKTIKVSRNFRDSMDKLIPQLFLKLSRDGTSLLNMVEKRDNDEREKIVFLSSSLEQSIKKENFTYFDVVQDYTDHHYVKNKSENCFTNTGSCVYKKILREWKILGNDLPDSIFVRVYEKRLDLLRAVIIGAQGTPYHDALFFFDIAFPSNYPEKPPLFFYMSHGLKLNPNLYKKGHVCLSLLNTWIGKENDKWNPSESTILQVLVSIQGLVLNDKPYYNEPLFIKPASSWENYNEKVFVLSCKTMLSQIQKPPKNFERFVADHFQDRAFTILRACEAYRDSCVGIGLFSYNGPSSSSQSSNIIISRKFRDSMDKLIPQLFLKFSRDGTSLPDMLEKLDNKREKKIEEPKIGLEQSIKKENFENFNLVEDYSDHHYAGNKSQTCFTDTGSCVYKAIMREWKILDNDLPDSIFVRVYEKRLDLLRAVIIGAQGTPYHDALFFFDIAFPSNYPEKPPLVFYLSHGPDLNPNLYSHNGQVCLSLLNTWPGERNEKWNPASSTILQVLVSIQGLVLNDKPYYNEPLFNKPASSWENYNEKVFALSCKTMLSQIQKPPKNFESFVADHFQDRAFTILRACEAYRDSRVRIGLFSYNGPSSSSSQSSNIIISRKFRDSMDKLIPQLFLKFSRDGNSLDMLEKLDSKREKKIEEPKIGDNKKNLNFFHKVLGIIGNEASLQNGLKKPDNDETKKKKIEPKIGDNILKKKNLDLFHRVFGRLELCLGLNNDNTIKSKALKI